jgi:hypothetical protein
MANLSFLAGLNEQQRLYAEIIRARAEELGVPGDLAVAVAYQESRLNPSSKDSGAGAVGIMQVRPIAARDVGMDPRSLRDPQKNIDAGILYLKKALDTTGDPRLAVIYYNAGPQRLQEFDRGADLPLETQQYLKDLRNYGAFRRPEPTPEPAAEPMAEPAAEPDAYQLPPRVQFPDRAAMQAEQEQGMAGLMGAGAGAALSGARAGWSGAKAGTQALGGSLAQGVMGKLQTQMPTLAPPQAPAGPAGAPAGLPGASAGAPGQPRPMAATAGAPMARPGVGGPAGPVGGPATVGAPAGTMPTASQSERVRLGNVDQGTTGLQRMRYNDQTAQQAARAKAAEQMFGQMARQGAVPMTTSQVLAGMPDLTSTSGGILVPTQSVQPPPAPQGPQSPLERLQQAQQAQRTARAGQAAASVGRPAPTLGPAVTPPPPVQGALPAPPAPKPSGLDQITRTFGEMARRGMPAVSAISRYAVPPLAGYQAGQELVAAKQAATAEDPDYLQAGLRGLGGVAAAASMFPAALPVAAPIALAAPTIAGLLERFQNRQVDEERPITEAELLQASRPAFRYPAMR